MYISLHIHMRIFERIFIEKCIGMHRGYCIGLWAQVPKCWDVKYQKRFGLSRVRASLGFCHGV